MEDINFKEKAAYMEDMGFLFCPNTVRINIPNAKKVLWDGIKYFTGDDAYWAPEYDTVSEWLTNNEGRGLLCIGNCGRGKTLICGKILPLLLNHYCRKVLSCYDAQEMNAELDSVKKKHLVYIDDIGTEGLSVKYGEKRLAFAELVDEAEKSGKLLVVTSNLSLSELREKYGERTLDRLKAITKAVLFSGESLRK